MRPGEWGAIGSPIRPGSDTALVGLIFVEDSQLEPVETPLGTLRFVQMVGITRSELDAVMAKTLTVSDLATRLQQGNPLWSTDLRRRDP